LHKITFKILLREQGCGAVVKTTQLRLSSSFFSNMASTPAPELLVYMNVAPAPKLTLFTAPVFCSFSHINIFNSLGVPQVEWKISYNKYTKLRECAKFLSNLIRYFLLAALLT